MGHHKGVGGDFIGTQGTSRVKPEPAKPQQGGPQYAVRERVRRNGVLVNVLAFADHQGRHQGGDPGVDVNHRATGEVEHPHVLQKAAYAPDPVGNGIVHEGRPQQGEDQERGELHPLGERADDQGRRDDREHGLKDHEDLVRNRGRVVRIRSRSHAFQAQPTKTAQPPIPWRKREAIAPQHPLDTQDPQHDHALHQDAQVVLPPDQPAIEKGQSWGHEHDQGRTRQHPCSVTGVYLRP